MSSNLPMLNSQGEGVAQNVIIERVQGITDEENIGQCFSEYKELFEGHYLSLKPLPTNFINPSM